MNPRSRNALMYRHTALGQAAQPQPQISTSSLTEKLATPIGKAVAAGAIAAAAAKLFPGRLLIPFIGGAAGAMMLGLIPDISIAGHKLPTVAPGPQA